MVARKINYKDWEHYDKVPAELKKSPFYNFGLKYDEFLSQHTPAILKELEDPNNLEVRNQVGGMPIRSTLKDISVCQPIISFFEKEFKGSCSTVHVNRSHVVDIPENKEIVADTSEIWISEFWHFDNDPRSVLAIGIYLNDVDEGTAPMVYENPPENNFYKTPIENYTGWWDSRFPDFTPKAPTKIVGPKHATFIFIPNFLHKATYARKKQRDAMYIRLIL